MAKTVSGVRKPGGVLAAPAATGASLGSAAALLRLEVARRVASSKLVSAVGRRGHGYWVGSARWAVGVARRKDAEQAEKEGNALSPQEREEVLARLAPAGANAGRAGPPAEEELLPLPPALWWGVLAAELGCEAFARDSWSAELGSWGGGGAAEAGALAEALMARQLRVAGQSQLMALHLHTSLAARRPSCHPSTASAS